MPNLKLHLDMDTSRKDLYKALLGMGYDVTRIPNEEIPEDASDEIQLLWATSHQRIILTFNIKDFYQFIQEASFSCWNIIGKSKYNQYQLANSSVKQKIR